VGSVVGIAVGVAVGSVVGVAVGVAVGSVVGIAVGVAVGSVVGVAVGVAVGSVVGVAVGVAVGSVVGVAVGVAMGVGVGSAVGVAVVFLGACTRISQRSPAHFFRSHPDEMTTTQGPTPRDRHQFLVLYIDQNAHSGGQRCNRTPLGRRSPWQNICLELVSWHLDPFSQGLLSRFEHVWCFSLAF
jgi:hypothetical protein